MEHVKTFKAVNEDDRYKDQFGFFGFNKNGSLRDFGMGFTKKGIGEIVTEFAKEGLVVIFYESGLYPKNFDKKYIESHYSKTSKENDLKDISSKMPFVLE